MQRTLDRRPADLYLSQVGVWETAIATNAMWVDIKRYNLPELTVLGSFQELVKEGGLGPGDRLHCGALTHERRRMLVTTPTGSASIDTVRGIRSSPTEICTANCPRRWR